MNTADRDGRDVRAEDEIDETLDAGPEEAAPEHAAQQDFAARTAMMSNALPGGASPAAGAVIGSGGELGLDPTTDEGEGADHDEGRRRSLEEAG
jgi:hypothetical protein